MTTASLLPASARARRRPGLRRLAAWLVASATDRNAAPWLVIGFATAHAVLWTFILINLKAAQDVHMDVAEAFAWGQKFQLGYGKHPPLAGWVAGLWFRMFPVADWATYALAMTTLACGLVISWLIALRVVDYRRAFFVVVMLALYPIFNFKGFKYNPDLLQLVTLPLLVLAYLDAFEKRTARSGLWLGLAGALALMTKYWVLTMIGAVGLAALIHPDRLKFLRSPAPWVAIAVAAAAMIPHLMWLRGVDFVPLTYAGDVYGLSSRAQSAELVLGYIGHNLALLAVPVVLAGLAIAWTALVRRPSAALASIWSRGANAGVNRSQALNIWIIQIVVAVGPPLGGLFFTVYMKTDWGISLFFLTPLALVAIPALRLRRIALFRITAIWLLLTLATLVASPYIAAREIAENPNGCLELRRALPACPRADGGMAQAFSHAMGGSRGDDGDRRADDVLQLGSSGAVHAGRSLVVGIDLARGSQAAWLYRHLRYVGRAAAGLRGLDVGQRQGCRTDCDHHAALLPRTPRSGDHLEDLYRAAGEVDDLPAPVIPDGPKGPDLR